MSWWKYGIAEYRTSYYVTRTNFWGWGKTEYKYESMGYLTILSTGQPHMSHSWTSNIKFGSPMLMVNAINTLEKIIQENKKPVVKYFTQDEIKKLGKLNGVD